MSVLDDARAAGFSDQEIQDWASQHRDDFRAAGFSDQEIDHGITGRKDQQSLPQTFLDRFMPGQKSVRDAMQEGWEAGYGKQPILALTPDQTEKLHGFVQRYPSLSVPARVLEQTIPEADVLFRGLNALFMAAGAGLGQQVSESLGQTAAQQESARHDWAQAMSIAAMLLGADLPFFHATSGRLVGTRPTNQDFTDAARVAQIGRDKVIAAYEERGVHPAEVADNPALANPPADVFEPKAEPAPLVGPTRADLAHTGDARIDRILNDPTVRDVINEAIVDGNYDVPYGAGGSLPFEKPITYIDRPFPREMEIDGVKFDPAEPFIIHENVEQHVMDELIAGGMDAEEAYRVAHYEYAEVAEGAWYKAMGIDQAKAEAAYKPYLDRIQHENPENPPPDLYAKPYPHQDVAAAQHEPTAPPPETRGLGRRFHGAPGPVTLAEGHYGSSVAYYGTTGLYTTDALAVARGYSRRRGAKQPTIYEVGAKQGLNFYDMEKPIADDMRAAIHGLDDDIAEQALEENPKNLREFYDTVREIAAGERIPADEIQEGIFNQLAFHLEDQGYAGMTHVGGKQTKTPPHEVTIFFRPERDIEQMREMAKEEIHPAEKSQLAEQPPSPAEIARGNAILDRSRQITPEGIGLDQTGGAQLPPSLGDGFGGGGMEPPLLEPPLGNGMNFTGPPLQAPNPRAPYFRYDDRNAFVKFAVKVIRGYKETFQPELISDKALQADPQFAQTISQRAAKMDQTVALAEENHQYWRTQSEEGRLRYMESVERRAAFRGEPPEWAQHREIHQKLFDAAYDMEKAYGSKADYFENYFPHIWEDPIRARQWVETKAAQVGPKWFQKERTFSTIREGMAEGLRLKSSNPEDLVTMRVLSSADMIEKMDLLQRLKAMDLAVEAKGAPGRLAREGWAPVNAPNMEQWLLAPDVQPTWKNAIAAKGFWANEGAPGTIFRGWMALKNVWVPVKLTLSLFHPLHVFHINFAHNLARAWGQTTSGDFLGALRSIGEAAYGGIPGLPKVGIEARQAWKIPEGMRTPEQQAYVQLMHDGGYIPELSEQLKIDARRAFEDAKDIGQWWKAIPQGMRRAIEIVQAPIFQEWIPNVKSSAYIRDAQALLTRRPELLDDPVQRRVALHTIAKSIDNRFGEMAYSTLFWNRYVKDAGIGSFLSLGWNLGFAREFGGGLLQPELRLIRRAIRGETETEATIRDAQNKFSFVVAYTGTAMLINGVMNYMLSGESPSGMDWFLPRIGGVNPNGSPRRVTNMFYTREVPMLAKHVEEKGPIAGTGDMLWNKMMFQPVKEWWENRSYYGADIWDENGPIYQKAWQYTQHVFKENFWPMSLTGASRAIDTGGRWWEAPMAMMGFGPAPSYAEKTGIENFIGQQYKRYVAPTSRPLEEGDKSKTRFDVRNQILLAKQHGDSERIQELAQQWFKNGGSRQGLSNIMLGIGSDVAMFRALPEASQRAVMERANLQEQNKYRPYLKDNVTRDVADMMVEKGRLQKAGDQAGAAGIDQQMQARIRKAVEDGHITNQAAFNRALQQQLLMRYQPQLGAIMSLPKRQRGQYMQQ